MYVLSYQEFYSLYNLIISHTIFILLYSIPLYIYVLLVVSPQGTKFYRNNIEVKLVRTYNESKNTEQEIGGSGESVCSVICIK